MCAKKSSLDYLFTEQEAIALAKRLQLFGEDSQLLCTINNGESHLSFCIDEKSTGNSIIISQALPPVIDNQEHSNLIDSSYLKTHSLLILKDIVPTYIPKVYYSDEKQAITVYDNVSHLNFVSADLLSKQHLPLLSTHIGLFLAHTLFYTSEYTRAFELTSSVVKQYASIDLSKRIEYLVFTSPFSDNNQTVFDPLIKTAIHEITRDKALMQELEKLKSTFVSKNEAIIHSDLHLGKIITNEAETKFINLDNLFLGPIGFEIGQLFGNILIDMIKLETESQEVFFYHICKLWTVFVDEFTSLWLEHGLNLTTSDEGNIEKILSEVFEDAVGFSGCEIIRQTIGPLQGQIIYTYQTTENEITAQKLALALGCELIKNKGNMTKPEQIKDCFKRIMSIERQSSPSYT